MEKLRDSTLVFLVRRSDGQIGEICLAMKKRGFGQGRWNGAGGKVEVGKETIEEAARRETQEEVGVTVGDLEKVAELTFHFPHNPSWDQLVHVYFCDAWQGEPVESEEMSPRWFAVADMPYKEMWADDAFWLPIVLRGERCQADFDLGEANVVLSHDVRPWV